MKRKFYPLADRVLIQDIKGDPKVGAIEVPEQVRDWRKPNLGVVRALGPGRALQSGEVVPIGRKSLSLGRDLECGDVVYYEANRGLVLAEDTREYEQSEFLVLGEERLAVLIVGNGSEDVRLYPLGDRLIIRDEESQGCTPGGLFVPDTARQWYRPNRGHVTGVGPGRLLENGKLIPVGGSASQIKVGDLVQYGPVSGLKLPDRHGDYRESGLLVMTSADIVGIWREVEESDE